MVTGGNKMGKPVKVFKVDNLSKVDTTKYVEGSFFITNQKVAMLVNGTLKSFPTSMPNLKQYVKKEDVEKMIADALKKASEEK